MMRNRTLVLASAAVIIAMVASGWWAGTRLPVEMRLPVHWNVVGEPDNYADKWTALMMPALVTSIVSLLFVGILRIDPHQENVAKSQGLIRVVWGASLALFVLIDLLVLDQALQWHVVGPNWLMSAIGLFFIALGNQLGKSRPMWFVGIRTPWTLSNEDVWIATHRLGGKLMVAAGLVWAVAPLFGMPGPIMLGVMILLMAIAGLVPIVYSYFYWRKLQRRV